MGQQPRLDVLGRREELAFREARLEGLLQLERVERLERLEVRLDGWLVEPVAAGQDRERRQHLGHLTPRRALRRLRHRRSPSVPAALG
ncbi:MAG: hypothetical protein EBT12_09675 [Marivivens sp.]|nr:hypothetical protein [Marivivens sp.]